MLTLTPAQVQALAPDASAAVAGKKLGKPGPWRGLGHSAHALWGECQGSALYQTQVALVDLVSKCSCPSRKFPCKHALGLLFLAAESPGAFPEAAEPGWVASWLEKRGAAQEKKQARAQNAAAKPVDEAAAAKRAEKRHGNILAGLDQLDLWLNDLVRQGLARLQGESPSFWDAQARRLVDAQAAGLATRIRRIGTWVGAGDDWSLRVLDELGLLALFTHAYRRLSELAPLLQADLRRIIGLNLGETEVIAHGDTLEDDWTVVAESTEAEERVRVQRAWLQGRASGRSALVLQFAAGGASFAEALALGTRFRARIAFWPSACPQRALIAQRLSQPVSEDVSFTGEGVRSARARFAQRLSALPWLERELFVLDAVAPVPGDPFQLVDRDGLAVALYGGEHDVLLALSGGHAITVCGEWDGYRFTPLSAFADGGAVSLSREPA